ncbi:MAG: nuclear transport factor 2 family protein [Alphaproteobacteria bacterium]|jgi:hypothetical protein|nr:nuclear transport factor 2 family protein [Alphaproteobacteria bacterium]MDP6563235.1 nuclear transport factor 2 family protein [Alphaproteobacteria bacterium]MDP6814883.1 nuclear transport factor 2 family protein [Alphaproteobacteria bacterium]
MRGSDDYLRLAADRVMIQDLLARYAWEVDHGRPEAFAALFTADGVFEIPAVKVWVRGREQLTAFAADLQATLPNVHHVMTNFVIDVDGDHATGRCELNEFMAREEAVYPNLQGWYEDEFVYRDEGWWIAHRKVFTAEPRSTVTGKVGDYFAAFHQACRKYRRSD